MTPVFTVGTLPAWEGLIEKRTKRGSVDSLAGTYRMSLEEILEVGDAVPGFSGMIIQSLNETNTGTSRRYSIEAEGSLDDSSPTKIFSRGVRKTLDTGWDERTIRGVTWHAEWKPCTAIASTDLITSAAHGLTNGQRVFFKSLTGGAGITARSISTLGTMYYIINRTADTFQISTTLGGSAVNITTDMSAGYVIAAEFALGAAHSDFSNMFLHDLTLEDTYNDWSIFNATYRGLEDDKPYRRTINGNVTSTTSRFDGLVTITSDIYQNHPPTDSGSNATLSGTDLDVEYDAATVSISDTYVTTTEPNTELIGQFWTPPDAPDVTITTLYGIGTKYFFPFGWKCTSMNTEKIPGRDAWLVTVNFAYQPATMPIS